MISPVGSTTTKIATELISHNSPLPSSLTPHLFVSLMQTPTTIQAVFQLLQYKLKRPQVYTTRLSDGSFRVKVMFISEAARVLDADMGINGNTTARQQQISKNSMGLSLIKSGSYQLALVEAKVRNHDNGVCTVKQIIKIWPYEGIVGFPKDWKFGAKCSNVNPVGSPTVTSREQLERNRIKLNKDTAQLNGAVMFTSAIQLNNAAKSYDSGNCNFPVNHSPSFSSVPKNQVSIAGRTGSSPNMASTSSSDGLPQKSSSNETITFNRPPHDQLSPSRTSHQIKQAQIVNQSTLIAKQGTFQDFTSKYMHLLNSPQFGEGDTFERKNLVSKYDEMFRTSLKGQNSQLKAIKDRESFMGDCNTLGISRTINDNIGVRKGEQSSKRKQNHLRIQDDYSSDDTDFELVSTILQRKKEIIFNKKRDGSNNTHNKVIEQVITQVYRSNRKSNSSQAVSNLREENTIPTAEDIQTKYASLFVDSDQEEGQTEKTKEQDKETTHGDSRNMSSNGGRATLKDQTLKRSNQKSAVKLQENKISNSLGFKNSKVPSFKQQTILNYHLPNNTDTLTPQHLFISNHTSIGQQQQLMKSHTYYQLNDLDLLGQKNSLWGLQVMVQKVCRRDGSSQGSVSNGNRGQINNTNNQSVIVFKDMQSKNIVLGWLVTPNSNSQWDTNQLLDSFQLLAQNQTNYKLILFGTKIIQKQQESGSYCQLALVNGINVYYFPQIQAPKKQNNNNSKSQCYCTVSQLYLKREGLYNIVGVIASCRANTFNVSSNFQSQTNKFNTNNSIGSGQLIDINNGSLINFKMFTGNNNTNNSNNVYFHSNSTNINKNDNNKTNKLYDYFQSQQQLPPQSQQPYIPQPSTIVTLYSFKLSVSPKDGCFCLYGKPNSIAIVNWVPNHLKGIGEWRERGGKVQDVQVSKGGLKGWRQIVQKNLLKPICNFFYKFT